MKTDRVLAVLVIVTLILLGLVYFQVMQQEAAAGKNFQALSRKVEGFEKAIAGMDAKVKSNVDIVKNVDAKVSAGDAERKDLAGKIESLSKEIQALQNDVADYKSLKDAQISVVPAQESPQGTTLEQPVTAPVTQEPAPAATP